MKRFTINRQRSIARESMGSLMIMIGALIIGGGLRLAQNDGPFSSSDHAELAAIVTFFYPRDLNGIGAGVGQSWQMFTSVHGSLPLLLALAHTTIIGLAGITITEWWWNLPFVVVGLLSIVVGARFAAALAGRRAGVIAALLLAVLPIHAVLSRASSLSHIPLMGLCQLLCIWSFLRYYEAPTPARARVASLALSVALLVELFFPVLLTLLFATGFLGAGGDLSLAERFRRTRRLFMAPQVLLAPLLVIIVTATIMAAYAAGLVPQGGTFSRLFGGSDHKAGLYLSAFWGNGAFSAGAAGFALLLGLGSLGVPHLIRMDRRALPLLWALAYLLPFSLFTRENVYGYFLMGLMGLALNAAIVLNMLWERGRRERIAAGLLSMLLTTVLALRAISIIFGAATGPLIGEGVAQGGVYADQGLKAASWWVRTTTGAQERIFADSQFEPYQIWYYLRRPAVSVTDGADPETAYTLLQTAAVQPKLYIVPPHHEALLYSYVPERPPVALIVTDGGRPILHVYSTEHRGTAETLEVTDGNRRFDQDFGGFRAMFGLVGSSS